MKNKNIVIVNGKKYDGKTGLLIKKHAIPLAPVANKQKANLKPIKSMAQKSIKSSVALAQKVGRSMDIVRKKNSINHTPPEKTQEQTTNSPAISSGKQPTKVTAKARVKSKSFSPKPAITKHKKTDKKETVKEKPKKAEAPKPEKTPMKKSLKVAIVSSVSFLVVISTAYLIYLFMPSLSVRVASAQAGINATYPEYRPDGYSPSGPVSYKDDAVTIDFHSKNDSSKFTIKQSKSSWDSSAVKAKAEQDASGEVTTTSERGLTIFTYKNNAIWVNGGILYSISGDASLSGDQIRQIATSL